MSRTFSNKGVLTCMNGDCGGPRQCALLLSWESTEAAKPPMRAYLGLEVCRPCAWKLKTPIDVLKPEFVEALRQKIADSGIGSPRHEASLLYCSVTHPEYMRFRRLHRAANAMPNKLN